jgi:hypothetical protein
MTRIPGGQGLREGRKYRVSSATCAPSRALPSASIAERQAWRGRMAKASRIGAEANMPTE